MTLEGKKQSRAIPPVLYEMVFPDGEDEVRRALSRRESGDLPQAPIGPDSARPGSVFKRPLHPPKGKGKGKGKGKYDDPPRGEDLDRYCRKLLKEIEDRCPGTLPTGPLPTGEIASPIEVEQDDVERLFGAALGVVDRRRKKQVVWEQAGSELLVHLHRVRLAVLDGLILIGIPVETVETKRVEVTVPFAVGNPDRLAGMVVTTEAKPRGPSQIVDLWGEALVAFAWQTLLDVIERLAARSGVDHEGAPLLPGAIVAGKGRIGLIPQAAHTFERRTV